ncbi:MAG: response regulator [Chloroflexota bacterium]
MNVKLLIVEDSENGTLFEMILQTLNGYKIEQAVNGVDGVRKYREVKPDVILMDLRMPIMDGFEATRLIRQEDQRIPIVIFSAWDDATARAKAKEAGATEFVPKVTSYSHLHALIQRLAVSHPKPELPAGETEASLKKQLRTLYNNLSNLNEQKAKHGLDVPTKLLNEIEETQAQIEEIEELLG